MEKAIENEDHTEHEEEAAEEAEAAINIWKYVFGFTEMAVVKCAIDLGISEALEKNGGSMSIAELSYALKCPRSYLYRVMRFLTHRKIFKQIHETNYTQTPLSRQLMTMAALISLECSPVMLSPWLALSHRVREEVKDDDVLSPFMATHGEDLWSFAANNPSQNKLLNEAMACDATVVVLQIVKGCPSLFDGVGTVVDVGGGDGTTLSLFLQAFPWLTGINFDLPHVVSNAPRQRKLSKLDHVGGDMFREVPKADVAFLKRVLHDWGDEECIEILKKCKEAIANKEKGKVIIIEAVIKEKSDEDDDEEDDDKLGDVRLMLDMVMMAHTSNGKERTLKEWSYLLNKAGFTTFHIKPIQAVQSIIQAYP